jgi:hypothetical protein
LKLLKDGEGDADNALRVSVIRVLGEDALRHCPAVA